MTVDTVVKIVESEKCGLDMSSYEDLNSSSQNVGGNVDGGGDGDGKDDYVFVNGSDVVPLDDRVGNRENGEVELRGEGDCDVFKVNGDRVENHVDEGVSEVKLSKEGDGGVKVNGDVVLSDDHVKNHGNEAKLSVEGGDNLVVLDDRVENKEVKLSVESDGDVKVNGDVVSSNDLVENHENEEVSEVKLSVEGGDNVEVNDDVVLSNDLVENHEDEAKVNGSGNVVAAYDCVENHENKEVNEGKLTAEGGGDLKVNDDMVTSDDHVENHENKEVNASKLGEDVVLSDDHVGNYEIEEVNVEEVDSVKVNGDAETDILEKEVKIDGNVLEVDRVSVEEELEGEVDGVGSVVDNGEINSGNEVVHAANGVLEVGEVSEMEPKVNEVKNGVVPECVVEEMKVISEPNPVVDEGKDDSIPERVLDEVKESNDPKPVVDEVKEAESVFETGDNGNASVDTADSRSLDAEVEAEDSTAVNGVPEALDSLEVKEGSVPELVVDEVREGSDPESVVEDVKAVDATIGAIGSRSLDVDDNNTRTDFVTQESAEVESKDSTAVNGVPDAHSEVEAPIKAPTVDIPEGGLEEKLQTVPPVENGTGSNGDARTELGSADYPVMESLDTDDKGLPFDGTNGTLVEEPSDFQQQRILSADGENEIRDFIEVEAKADKQGDVVEPVEDGESQESMHSEVAGSELDQCEKGENTDQTGLDSLPSQSEGPQNQGNLEIAAQEMDNPVSIIARQSDERKIKSTAGVEENSGALTADSADKPALEDETERVDGDVESEEITESGRIQVDSPEDGALQDQVTEQTRSFDVVDKEISSVESSLDQNDQGGTYARENNAENKDAPASEQLSEEAGNGLRSDGVKEQAVGNDISAADNSLSDSPLDTELKAETVHSETDVAIKTNTIFDGISRPEISFGSFGSELPVSYNDINSRSDVLYKHNKVSGANDEGVLTPANGDHSDGLNHDTNCSKVAPSEQIDEVSASSVEGSEADCTDAQNVNPDLVRRPFYWLIRVPRFDEEKYKEQLRQCERELAEKTKTRDAFQTEFNKQQGYCRELRAVLEAANSEVKAARDLTWAKSRELDSAHSSINLARHAVTAEDLDKKIHNLEHRMQHQTLNNLREEKELVREIKQLTLQRQKLSTDPERMQAIQQARAHKDQIEEQLKVLKKELSALKDNLSKADGQFRAARKKHDDASDLLTDFKRQLKSANDIRQEAYIHLITLKKQLNEKNSPFFKAKNDLRVAYNYATAGDKDSLEHHCVNQVEKIMEMWNKNDEFRKEYIQSNMSRTLYKFGLPDGTSLGIDEVRESPEGVNVSAKANSPTEILTREMVLPEEPTLTEDKLLKKVEQGAAAPAKKIEAVSKNNLAKASDIIEIEEDTEKPKLTKEEEELAKKAEQLKREEEATRLMEQRRLEEKAKAEEALERKRRNALKAQARAEFKARKEAEEKEKEREKRAKKKGKKRGINIEITENEPAQPSEPSLEQEVTEKLATKAKRTQKASLHSKQIKTTKPIPAALRNKGKRGFLQYWPYPLIVLLAIALFYLGSYERIQTIRQHISALLHR